MARQTRPGPAAIRRLVEAAAGPVRRRISVPRRAPRLPHRSIDDAWIARLEREVDRAGVLVPVERPGPVFAAVDRTEHAAFGIRSVRVAECGDEHDIRVAR